MTRTMSLALCMLTLCGALACQSDAPKKQDAIATPTDGAAAPAASVAPSAPESQPAVEAPAARAKLPKPTGDGGTRDIDELVRGKTMAALQATYGPPDSTYEVKLDEGVPEFRVELLNDYAPGAPESKGVIIMEHTYRYSEDGYKGVIWYHDVDGVKTALQAMVWEDGVEF
jgi:hypothetical protein